MAAWVHRTAGDGRRSNDGAPGSGQRPDTPTGADPEPRPDCDDAPPGIPDLRVVLQAAAMASRRGNGPLFAELIEGLDEASSTSGGHRLLLVKTLEAYLVDEVRRAWARGWQPADVVRVAGRELTARHARYATDVIAVDAVRYAGCAVDPRWTDQLEGLGATVWWDSRAGHIREWAASEDRDDIDALHVSVEVLGLLLDLPVLPRLCDLPGQPGHVPRRREGHDGRMLARVRALLAKAESTTFAEEAEALTAKAQELMARHAIDEAMVDGGATPVDGPGGVRLAVDDPYASAKSLLLSEVASANSCRAVWSKEFGFSTVFGFDNAVEFVEVLYTSLLVQATAAMNAAGSQIDRYGRSRTRSFRQSFLVAYASRIGDRLRAAEAAGRASATVEYGEALLPVLADRSSAVDDVVDSAFPKMRAQSLGMSNFAGWAAGSAAADLASLSVRPEVPSGGG